AIASFGHGAVAGLMAPGEPQRRLIPVDDRTAVQLTRRFAWAMRVLGAAIFLNVILRAVFAPVSLTIATSVVFAVIVVALVAETLLRVKERGEDGSGDARAQWIRAGAWVVVTAVLVSLALGYIGFAAFLAGRMLIVLAVLAELFICLVFTDALFTE